MRKITIVITFLILVLSIFVVVLAQFFIINKTDSFPKGIYIRVFKEPEKGDLVKLCPPNNEVTKIGYERNYFDSGLCPGGYEHIIKKIVAVQGDIVLQTENAVYVNNVAIANTKTFTALELPNQIGFHEIQEGECFVLSDYNIASFDSRYFGTVPVNNIKYVIKHFF